MKTKQLKTCGLLLLLSMSIFACKKDESSPEPKNALSGAWAKQNLSNGYASRLIFGTEGNFAMELKDSASTYFTRAVVGKYLISNDSLKVNITSEVQKSPDGKITSTSPLNYTLFDKGKFVVENDILTIKYITYPADGPVPTTSIFNRIIAID